MSVKEDIRKLALKNAVMHNGNASPGAIIGGILGSHPELRSKAKEVMEDIQEVVKEVNKLGLEKQTAELKKIAPGLLEKKEKKKKELPDLPNAVMGKVVTRIPPEPSKYNHIGHALSFLINYLYAKKYKGKCILRFEDTNPEKASQEYVDAMKEDVLDFLDIKPSKTVFVSDDMKKFYELAEQAVNSRKAYVCTCTREEMQKNRHNAAGCSCRFQTPEQNIKLWKDMLAKKFKPGKAVLRLLIDMAADNHVMRDPVIMRICTTKHYRQGTKYTVWPMYDFENAIEEELCGITHIMRSSEFGSMRVELQDYIKDLFGFRKQEIRQYGRFNITGATTQGRVIREMIEQKKVSGWDDPRLVTLRALKRRGFVKETFYELVKEVGLSASQTNIDWTILSSINRKILDSKADRFFFIKEPVKVNVKGAPEQKLDLSLHPDRKGGRKIEVKDKFHLEKSDADGLKGGKLYRLMDCLNFTKKGRELVFDSLEHERFKEKGEKIMHWLPDDVVNVEVLMDDGSWIKGIGEKNLEKVKVGQVVQFEREFFARLDKKEKNKLVFWFTHK